VQQQDVDSESDAELVAAFRDGARQAFATLIERHRPRALGLARALLRDRDAAEDVAQEATYQAYFDIGRLRQPERFGAWLCGIVYNLARMELRRRRALSLDGLAHVADRADETPGVQPDLIFESSELRERVQAALRALPPEMREAVWLHYVEGVSYAEAGSRTGIAPGTLRVLSHRARGRLRDELAPEWQSRRPDRRKTMIEVTVQDVEVRMPKQPPAEGRLMGVWTVLLKSKGDGRTLRIWVWPASGQEIATFLTGTTTPRPTTHAFFVGVLGALAVRVELAVVSSLVEETYLATVRLRSGRKVVEVDARPSDAINLALRTDAPIFVAEDVMDSMAFLPGQEPPPRILPGQESRPELRDWDEFEWWTGARMLEAIMQRSGGRSLGRSERGRE
jgi:RNA polymerase sigma-70 factor (ECF subfamily)